ncbi:MAG: hypothetical protein ACOX1P_02565 [Thermoguttaceae bacterium]|jgi:hypothetical protein
MFLYITQTRRYIPMAQNQPGHWRIDGAGRITVARPTNEWHNRNLGDRTATILNAAVDYYRYSGDPTQNPSCSIAAPTGLTARAVTPN